MTFPVSRFVVVAALAVLLTAASACGSNGSDGSISGEVRFAREVDLPEGAVVTVTLLDTSLADAGATELGRAVIEGVDRLPVRFRIAYDRSRISDRAEYSLHADVQHGGDLLYINDTDHPVLTRGAPGDSDVVVVSTNPFDTCVEPLPGEIHSSFADEALPADAVLTVRLVDVTQPEESVVVTEVSRGNLEGFPIEFELPHHGVRISRHHRYELEAEISAGGELLYHIPTAEWRRIWLPHCPGGELRLVNDVFPDDRFPME
ncbi:MAG: YbaY family lipoprotein [Chloroflexota bacterium]|nr:YbaY family lipoprotein [Chloroflexota bacterium]MDE2883867.1 YbaY family lipoprotein [Chloroflexota bacterium]